MKLKNSISSFMVVGVALFALSSCSSKLTDAQREGLKTVQVSATGISADAYGEPYGGNLQAKTAASNAGVTSGTGALGGALGALIGEGIAAGQNSGFKRRESAKFDRIKSITPSNNNTALNKKISEGVRANAFFGSRVTTSSPNRFQSEVLSYRLGRAGKDKDTKTLLMSPTVTAMITLTDASGKKVLGGNYVGVSPTSANLDQYLANPSLLRSAYDGALQELANTFVNELNEKTAP